MRNKREKENKKSSKIFGQDWLFKDFIIKLNYFKPDLQNNKYTKNHRSDLIKS